MAALEMTTDECPFCALAAGSDDEVVAVRTGLVLAAPNPRQRPKNRGHVLIIPAAHITRLVDADPLLLQELYGLAGRVCMAVRDAFGATGSMLFQNENLPDQELHHLHIHVVPRRAGDDFRLPDPVKDQLTRAERVEQARAVAKWLGVAKA
jgi:diadenosine tetraphosphate (Ap4A) HIT family hydrolase